MTSLSPPVVLDASHLLSDFDCEVDSLNTFLKFRAFDKQKAKLSRTYVVVDGGGNVAAYYTLAIMSIQSSSTPQSIGRRMPNNIPAILLARLAIDKQYKGLGLGKSLLVDALNRIYALIRDGAAPVRCLVVDAIDNNAKAFYEHFDMVSLPSDPNRLYLSYKAIISLFED